MMREIKFRAWDRKTQTMIYDWVVIKPISPTTPDLTASTKHSSPPWYIGSVMQYTGLKDKNSKEIYEGDIVQPGGWDVKWVVGFMDGSFTIATSPMGEFHTEDEVEVIGNIYENPELLEV